MSTEMTVTRAIATQKALTARIADAVNNLTLVVPTRGEGDYREVEGFKGTIAECEEKIKAAWQRYEDYVALRNDIRAALVKSNATTTITICGKQMTIVEALDFRNTIGERQALLKRLKANLTQVTNHYDNQFNQHQAALGNIRNEALNSNKKIDENFEAMFITPRNQTHKPDILNPLNVADIIEKMEKEISDFALNVDYALSESNAVTKIKVENRGNLLV